MWVGLVRIADKCNLPSAVHRLNFVVNKLCHISWTRQFATIQTYLYWQFTLWLTRTHALPSVTFDVEIISCRSYNKQSSILIVRDLSPTQYAPTSRTCFNPKHVSGNYSTDRELVTSLIFLCNDYGIWFATTRKIKASAECHMLFDRCAGLGFDSLFIS